MNSTAAKIAVVTGANKGIGRSIVKLLCQQNPNWIVYLTARNAEKGQEAVEELKAAHAIFPRFHQLDVESPATCQRFKEFLTQEHPNQGISVLVNNAAILYKTAEDVGFRFDREKYRKTISTNYLGVVNVCSQLMPLLTSDARVVMVSSRMAMAFFAQLSNENRLMLQNCTDVSELSTIITDWCELAENRYFADGWSSVPLEQRSLKWPILSGDFLPYALSKLGVNILTMIYQKQFDQSSAFGHSSIIVNACTPGLALTDMNRKGVKTPDEGADVPVFLATLPADTTIRGMFLNDDRTIMDLFIDYNPKIRILRGMVLPPFDDIVSMCSRRGFNAYDLVRQLQKMTVDSIFGMDFATIVRDADQSTNACKTFCEQWLLSGRLDTVPLVIAAAQRIGDYLFANFIKDIINDIIKNKHFYNNDPVYQRNISDMERLMRHFVDSHVVAPMIEPPPYGTFPATGKIVFFSYTRQCRSVDVAALADRIGLSFPVLFERTKPVGCGSTIQGIEASDIIIVCFSEAYKTRCFKELCYAETKHKYILVVMLEENVDRCGECWILLQGKQRVPYYSSSNLDNTVAGILEILTNGNLASADITRRATAIQIDSTVHTTATRDGVLRKLKCIDVPAKVARYYPRGDDENEIKGLLSEVARNPNDGVALILGGSGNGKSTLISNILLNPENDDYFYLELNIHVVLWLNCYQWHASNVTDKASFETAIFDKLSSALVSKEKAMADGQLSHLQDILEFYRMTLKKRILFVLDDCFDKNLISILKCQAQDFPCCAISRLQETFMCSSAKLLGHHLVQGLSRPAIVEMFARVFSLNHKLNERRLNELADRCCGSPLVAFLIAGNFDFIEDADEIDRVFQQIMNNVLCKSLLKTAKLAYNLERDEEVTAYSLFNRALEVLDSDQIDRYHAFLLLDPVEAVRIRDLAIFWEMDESDATIMLRLFHRMALVINTEWKEFDWMEEVEPAYKIHQILHEAAFEKAKRQFNLTKLSDVRIAILTSKIPPYLQRVNTASKLVHRLDRMIGQGLRWFCETILSKFRDGDFFHLRSEDVLPIVRFNRGDNKRHLLHSVARRGDLDLMVLADKAMPDALARADVNERTILHASTCYGHLEVTKYIVGREPSLIHNANIEGRTPLHAAAHRGHLKIVEFLIHCDAKLINEKNKEGWTPLYAAATGGHLSTLQFLASCKPSLLFETNNNKETPLHASSRAGRLNVVKHIVQNCERSHKAARDRLGKTPLHAAAESSQIEVVKFLLENDSSLINEVDDSGQTVLHAASKTGRLGVVSFLAEFEPGLLLTIDYQGRSPLHYCSEMANIDVADYLMRKEPSLLTRGDASGSTPLHVAVDTEWSSSLTRGSVNVPLATAATFAKFDIAKFMTDRDTSQIATSASRQLVQTYSEALQKRIELVKMFVSQNSAIVFMRDEHGRTPFFIASIRGIRAIVEYLAASYPDVIPIADKFNQTPMCAAAAHGQNEIATFIASTRVESQ